MASRGALERAPVKVELIRLLATGEHTVTELGKRYGVSHQAIGAFAVRHAARIAQVADRLDDQFAGIVYADKVNRLAELSEQVDRVLDLVTDPARAAKANVGIAETERVIQTALRNIAEELGQLPNRSTVQHEGAVSVRYELVGVNPEDLS